MLNAAKGPTRGHGARQGLVRADDRQLVRGPSDAPERRLVGCRRSAQRGTESCARQLGHADLDRVPGELHQSRVTARPPRCGRPVVSGRPRARFMHWTAPPAVPLVRLSRAATATSRPAALVDGDLDVHGVGSQHGLGLRPLTRRQQVDEGLVGVRRRRRPRRPARWSAGSASGAVQVARMPRDIGTSTGVNDTVGAAAPQAREVLDRSRGCAGAPRRRRTRWPSPSARSRAGGASGSGPRRTGRWPRRPRRPRPSIRPPVTAGSRARVAVVG